MVSVLCWEVCLYRCGSWRKNADHVPINTTSEGHSVHSRQGHVQIYKFITSRLKGSKDVHQLTYLGACQDKVKLFTGHGC